MRGRNAACGEQRVVRAHEGSGEGIGGEGDLPVVIEDWPLD